MTTILALDLATSTGWAMCQAGQVTSGAWNLRVFGEDIGARLFGFQSEVAALLSGPVNEQRVVYYEKPWVGPKTHQNVAELLMSLAGITRMVTYEAGGHCHSVTAPQWRKHFLGRGRGSGKGGTGRKELKRLAVERCVQLGYAPKSEDEAEAIGILDYALAKLRENSITGAGPLFRGAA